MLFRSLIRTERTAPFERADFTNLSIGALAESIRFELMHPFLDDGLANRWFNHSPNSPYFFGGSGEIRTHGSFRIVCFQDRCNKPDSATLPINHIETHQAHKPQRSHRCSNLFGTDVLLYGRDNWNRTNTNGVKVRCATTTQCPNKQTQIFKEQKQNP